MTIKPHIYRHLIPAIATIYLIAAPNEGFYIQNIVHDPVKQGYSVRINIELQYLELIPEISSR